MLKEVQITWIRSRMGKLTGTYLPGPPDMPGIIDISEGESLAVRWDGERGSITAPDGAALARGYFLIGNAIRNSTTVDVKQERHFRTCGPFIDCSRGAVPTVDALERYIDHAAALGLNVVALYMQDTYTIPEYPYFGHLRGRYTQRELKELDEYCSMYDIELLPCIQTLAHLQQFLQWKDSRPLTDTEDCLLIGSEETYSFIEAAVRSLRSCVSTRRLHIGMDEAHDVGLGRYLQQHGPVDRFKLLNEHLTRVTEICRKYDFEPMMWSDMFFRLGSSTGDYYDPDCHVPQSVIDGMPDVGMVYWDYYHMDEPTYEHMLAEHDRMNKPVIFAGGNWTWSGFLPQVLRTEATTLPAMRVCVRRHTDTVLATMWGDDGSETDVFLALSQLPLFSQACWLGEAMTPEAAAAMGEALTGLPREAYEAFGLFYADKGSQYTGKAIVYGDLLLPVMSGDPDLPAAASRAEAALAVLEKYSGRSDCRYAAALFRLVRAKALLIPRIRAAYAAKDRAAFKSLAFDVGSIIHLTEDLRETHRERWNMYHKRQGWELFSLRYGALIGRLEDVRRELLDYAAQNAAVIEALEQPILPSYRWTQGYFWHGLTDPKAR